MLSEGIKSESGAQSYKASYKTYFMNNAYEDFYSSYLSSPDKAMNEWNGRRKKNLNSLKYWKILWHNRLYY